MIHEIARTIKADVMPHLLPTCFNNHVRKFFENGYGVSIVDGECAGPGVEIAVLDGDEAGAEITYSTGLTEDVERFDCVEEALGFIEKVKGLRK